MPNSFANRLLAWYDKHGRHHLPWQQHKTAYKVWVSEIMLQQTQVTTVIEYYQRFMQSFPNVKQLALAPTDQVLEHWAGLGYYARARNLHKAAQMVHEQHKGRFPKEREALEALPGIGRSTAAAILSLTHNIVEPILDGNVKRVFARHFHLSGYPNNTQVLRKFWQVAETEVPSDRPGAYNQALMDLGSSICTRSKPRCGDCPVAKTCEANKLGLQAELPNKKPKANRPEKRRYFLLIRNASGQTLLYKRPDTGIWGGLWSLPECERKQDIGKLLATLFADWQPSKHKVLSGFHHDFSHYRLHLEPIEIVLTPSVELETEQQTVWYQAGGKDKAVGLPAPIKKLLELEDRNVAAMG